MAAIRPPLSCKLIVGLLAGRAEVLAAAAEALAALYGPIELASPQWPFSFTDYYQAQMGQDLLRQFLAFEKLIGPADIVAIKRRTNQLEEQLTERFAGGPARPVNIDPGYLTEGKLVLASAKGLAHRVYMDQGIYAEITLSFVHGRWVSHPYTFPDYGSGLYDGFLIQAREGLRRQLGR